MSVQNVMPDSSSISPMRMSNTFRSTLQFGSHLYKYPNNKGNRSNSIIDLPANRTVRAIRGKAQNSIKFHSKVPTLRTILTGSSP